MKVKFAQISYKEISETRDKVFQDYTQDIASWRSIKESSLCYLKRLPFLIIWAKLLDTYLKHCNAVVVNSACAFLGLEDIISKINLTVISVGLFALFSLIVIFSIARHVFPQKTPINDMVSRMRKFHGETECLEDITRIMDKLQKLSAEDLAYTELIVDENNIVLMIKNSEWGYIEKNQYTVKNEDVLKTLRETGVLDFSSIDDDWNMFKEKYQIV